MHWAIQSVWEHSLSGFIDFSDIEELYAITLFYFLAILFHPRLLIIIPGLQIHICKTLMRRLNKKRVVHAFYLTQGKQPHNK